MTTTPTFTIPTLDIASPDSMKLSAWHVVRSEWLKLRTLRSSWVVVTIAIASLAAIGFAVCWSTVADWNHIAPFARDHVDALRISMAGFELSELALGVLGIVFIGGEYSTGQIRSSIGAVPKRLPVLWTKAGLLGTVTLITMLPAALVTFFVSQRILSREHIQTTWSSPNVARSVIGVALYLTVVAMIGVGLGAVLRNIAGGIAGFVGIMTVLPAVASALPQQWGDKVNKFLPSNAGRALLSVQPNSHVLTPWTGFALFLGYGLALLVVASFMLTRRDA
jgi:hypothetical protein